ncbi:glycosyltransferase [Alisedimentitalea sp. MJ-SS2]|uniref:glycosyltransferase n=1 Tax=Aliisedimentitalea sp. MJ-SS2 TaxID=3049795 RepID=UPI00290A4550|nr:glycosyltransferase [Alisedimentitalea sp. MJ-SS2]MDU8929824.1 glycosyltransferase [Alisedimentitalea sp. MJ-SS2]
MANGRYTFLFDVEESSRDLVFYDASRVRKKRVRRLALSVIFVAVVWLGVFFAGTISLSGVIDEIALWWNIKTIDTVQPQDTTGKEAKHDHSHDSKATFRESRAFWAANAAELNQGNCGGAVSTAANTNGGRVIGYVPTALQWAPSSLEMSCDTLDVVVTDWITIKVIDGQLNPVLASNSVREAVETYLNTATHNPELMPSVILDTGYDVDGFLARMSMPQTRATLVSDLADLTAQLDATGLCLDFRQLNAAQLLTQERLFADLAQKLKTGGHQACGIFGAGQDVWSDNRITRHFDTVILKAFQDPWVGSPPAPLSGDAWFADTVQRALTVVGTDRLTIALGSFAADWATGKPVPQKLAFAEAMTRMAESKTKPVFSPETGNTFATYRDTDGRNHKLWVLDAASFHNQLQTLKSLGLEDVAVWSLGTEDPGIWTALQSGGASAEALASNLSKLRFRNYVAYRGEGAFLRVSARPRNGFRTVNIDTNTGRIADIAYEQTPRPYILERYGQPELHKLVLTFDDGPHETYTRDILDVLEETQTPGAFFVVGTQVLEEPDLLQRMIDEGHEVGSHTYSHPRMDQISWSRGDLELGMMKKLIAGYTGRTTSLYREPFLRAGGPITEDRVWSLEKVQASGGIISGMEIVPKDWEGLSAQAIAKYVIDEVNNGVGNVIVLHDGGQDRTATVEALPIIIGTLKAQGYEFTSLADLLGTTPAALMPAADGEWVLFDRVSFGFFSATWFSLKTIFWVVLAIGVVRTLIILILALLRRRSRPVDDGFEPKVTVVIPAHNEEKVINRCVNSVLASDYGNFDVMIIDDGSTDGTFDKLLRFLHNPRIQVFAQLNQGKWSALNAAVANTDSEVIVCIDADTQIAPDAIRHLARQFSNPKIGAVAGKITVGNRRNLLTRLQALEYVTAQNFDRRAYDLVNGMLVVPGAIGAWRVAAVRDAGRYCNDTMTEDADLTVAVNRFGYRVTYEEKAVAYTEAPESVSQLLTQRLRWSLGMFQTSWKHKGAFRQGRAVGLFSIPDMLIFGYLFPLLAPIADIFVVILLYKLLAGTWSGEVGAAVSSAPNHLILAYLILPMLDLVVAAYALKSDGQEKMRLLWLFPFQRFFYRQLLYFSVYRSVLRAITGTLAGWGQMKRTGYEPVRRPA